MSAPTTDTPASTASSGARSGSVALVFAARSKVARRIRLVTLILLTVMVVAFALNLAIGSLFVSPWKTIPAIFGVGERKDILVMGLRLPRAVLAALVGIAFGMSGAIFQSLARNPLASPDILGITAGGSLFAVVGITIVGISGLQLSLIATLGALLTAVLIYVLAYNKGLSSYRLVLIGIGIGAVALALLQYFWTRAHAVDAQSATVWLSGSLNGRKWEVIWPLVIMLVVLVPAALVLNKRLAVLELGDDSARAVGLGVQRSQALLLLVAVGFAGAGIGAAGPVAFVAFVSAPIARRLCRSPGPAVVPAGLAGATLVLVSDLIGRTLATDGEVAVGIITGIIGAPYLLWLLVATNRTGKGN